ncbi:MAG TPA: MFS transporter [Rhizomicrobium sp.]|jgi:MHS family alpha-ketoglutarate permease-like MFS transporter
MQGRSASTNLKSIIVGSVGNLVEWYDWYTYPSFALYFAKTFFPSGDQTAQLLNAAAAFAVGFLMRPIGGWLLGLYADRVGRRPALILSMVLMAVGSAGVGLIPGYASIGVLAPVLLVTARLLQGFSVGGQYAASASYLSEIAKQGHRGFWTSFHYVTLLMGLLLAIGLLFILQHTITNAQIAAWAWRVPFFVGAGLAIAALLITLGVEESGSFEKAQTKTRTISHAALFARHWRELLIVFVITMAGTIAFQTYGTYMPKYLVNTAGFSPDLSTEITLSALVIYTLIHPPMGWLSDKLGRKTLLIAFSLAGLVTTVPIMTTLAGTTDPYVAFGLLLLGMVLLCPYTAVSAIFKAELFPTEIRAMAVGISFATSVSVFGGTSELIALNFKKAGHEPWFYWYMTASFGLSLIAALAMRRPADAVIAPE